MEDKDMIKMINEKMNELHLKCLETKKEFHILYEAVNKKDLEFNEHKNELLAYLKLSKLDKYRDDIDYEIIRTINSQNKY